MFQYSSPGVWRYKDDSQSEESTTSRRYFVTKTLRNKQLVQDILFDTETSKSIRFSDWLIWLIVRTTLVGVKKGGCLVQT